MLNKNHFAIIMAGGVGSRFWPVSRTALPKQFIDVLGTGRTLIQDTYRRFLQIVPEENIYILTNALYTDLVKEQLGINDSNRIIGEPAMRNTAPCIAYACHKIHSINPDSSLVVAPSDHLIQDTDEFIDNVLSSLNTASANDVLITLGIKPSRPDTGYGYIHFTEDKIEGDFHKVDAFKEKPPLAVAENYVNSGEYLWNAGIFIWSTKMIVKELGVYEPELNATFENGATLYNTAGEADFLLTNYPTCKSISIDYAVMEKSDKVYVLPVDFGWSDLGTWTSVYGLAQKDAGGNVLIPGESNVILYNSYNCMINIPHHKRIVVKDLEGYIIVESNNTLLICPKSSEQEVKQIVADAQQKFGKAYI